MTTKPDLTRVWASGAPVANVEDPDVTTPGKFEQGWIAEVPTYQNFNYLQRTMTQGLAHMNEQGISEWDADTTYPTNGLAKGSDGEVYLSQQEQSGNNPVSDSGENWLSWFESKTTVRQFTVLSELIASTNVKEGDIVSTVGYSNIFDNGGNFYQIVAASTGVDDGGSYIDLSGSGLQAQGIFLEGNIRPEQFGARASLSVDDRDSIQSAVYFASGSGRTVEFTSSDYRIDSQIITTDVENLTMQGYSSTLHWYGTIGAMLGGDDTDGLKIKGLSFNQRISLGATSSSHGISVRNARNCFIIDCTFFDYSNFAVLFFTDNRNVSGVSKNNHIINCFADGYNASGGGFGMESQIDSTISGYITGVTGNIFSTNLKNECDNCHVDVIVSNSTQGFAASDDGPNAIGAGCKNCTIRVTATNCSIGASANKTANCHFDVTYYGTGSAGDVGLAVYGFNINSDYDVSLENCDPAGYAITSRSDDQAIHVRRYDNTANKLMLLEPGTDRNRVYVANISSGSGAGPNIADLIDNDAANTNNEFVYQRDLPMAYWNGSSWRSELSFPVAGQSRTNNQIVALDFPTMSFRVNGQPMLALEQAAPSVSAGSDNTIALGRASVRYTQLFATTSTINTSDGRLKEQERALSDVEKDIALELKAAVKMFKWKDAVVKKGEDGARWHCGWIAQEVISIFESHGLDAFDYGMVCYDEWEEREEELNSEGEVILPKIEAGDRYGVRQEQINTFIIGAL